MKSKGLTWYHKTQNDVSYPRRQLPATVRPYRLACPAMMVMNMSSGKFFGIVTGNSTTSDKSLVGGWLERKSINIKYEQRKTKPIKKQKKWKKKILLNENVMNEVKDGNFFSIFCTKKIWEKSMELKEEKKHNHYIVPYW